MCKHVIKRLHLIQIQTESSCILWRVYLFVSFYSANNKIYRRRMKNLIINSFAAVAFFVLCFLWRQIVHDWIMHWFPIEHKAISFHLCLFEQKRKKDNATKSQQQHLIWFASTLILELSKKPLIRFFFLVLFFRSLTRASGRQCKQSAKTVRIYLPNSICE